ncbi:MAG: hypothetical protein ABJA70_12545, partial [Chryseolinea sp.]
MPKFYQKTWGMLVVAMCLALCTHVASAQCSITNLQPAYCSDDAAFALTGGTNYYGPGVSGSTFSPSSAGIGTHTIYTTDGNALSYSTSTTGTYNPDLTVGTPVSFPGLPADENSSIIGIGFTFNFFGNNYANLRVNANGYVGVALGAGSGIAQTLPDPTAPNGIIAGAWDDLDISLGGSVTTALSGTAPLRTFLVNFNSVAFATGPQTVSFQIQFHESTNIIEIHSINIQDNGGAGMTQGIENGTGTIANFLPGRNAGSWTATNDYVAFIPTCVDTRTVTISAPPSAALAVTAPGNVCSGTGASVTIANSESGVLYELRRVSDNASISSIYPGTGSNLIIVSGVLAASTDIKVYARNAATGCDTDLTTTVTIDPSFLAPVINTQPLNSIICAGANTSFSVGAGTTTAPTYQ